MELPQSYQEDMRELLKDEYQDYLDSFNKTRFHGLRVNTDKISVSDFLKIAPFKLERVPWCESGFYYQENERVSKHPYYYAGLYYIQEPSAMIPASVLSIAKDDIVLDGCGAPGGKSVHIANKLHHSGLLISNDISASRSQATIKNIELFGLKNVVVTSCDMKDMAEKYPHFFDKILLDVPCSGQGMFRKEPSLIKSYKDRNDAYYQPLQRAIIDSAIKMLANQGELVYSTCTFSKKENEENIQYLLEKYPFMKLKCIQTCEGFVDGIEPIKQAKRLYPHRINGEGHFVCRLQKDGLKEEKKYEQIYSPILPTYVQDFLALINWHIEGYHYEIIGENLYLVSNVTFNKQSLRIMRSGLLMGRLNKNKFEPSTALALALKKEEFQNVINLSIDDNRVLKYLKGETIDVREFAINGYVLMCVDGYSLGFGKITNGIFKNKYGKEFLYI